VRSGEIARRRVLNSSSTARFIAVCVAVSFAVCCSVFQCVAVCCSVSCIVRSSVLQCVAVC